MKTTADKIKVRDKIVIDDKKLVVTYVDRSFKDMIRLFFEDGSGLWFESNREIKIRR